MRAYLTVPTPSPAALACGADALVVERLPEAIGGCAAFMRIGPLGPGTEPVLDVVMRHGPAAIVVPAMHGRDVADLGARLAVHEAEHGLPDGATRIVAMIATAAGVLAAGTLAGSSRRLAGIGWDREALARELGLSPGITVQSEAQVPSPMRERDRVRDQTFTDRAHPSPQPSPEREREHVALNAILPPPLTQARSLVRLAAASAGVEAIEAAYGGADEAGFLRHLAAARRDGFGGLCVLVPEQVALIRRGMTES